MGYRNRFSQQLRLGKKGNPFSHIKVRPHVRKNTAKRTLIRAKPNFSEVSTSRVVCVRQRVFVSQEYTVTGSTATAQSIPAGLRPESRQGFCSTQRVKQHSASAAYWLKLGRAEAKCTAAHAARTEARTANVRATCHAPNVKVCQRIRSTPWLRCAECLPWLPATTCERIECRSVAPPARSRLLLDLAVSPHSGTYCAIHRQAPVPHV